MIHLEPGHLQIVKDILKRNLATRKVVVFGSRATGRQKTHSDLDLCVIGESPLSLQELAKLNEDFSESDLPMRVDVVDWAITTPAFRAIIQQSATDFLF